MAVNDEEVSEDTLRIRLGLLLADGTVVFQDTTLQFQRMLEERFNARYNLDRINDELEILWIENEVREEMEKYKGGMSKYLYSAIIPEDYDY